MYMPMYNLLGSSSTITYRWDALATAGVQDGVGTWGTDSFWTSNNGVTRVAWVNGSIAQFGGGVSGTAGTVATSGTPTCSGIIFNLPFGGNYIISTALTLIGLATVTANGGAPTISAVISGSAGFRKNGTGALVISGVNTFTGTVYIDDGTLTIFNSAALNVTHPVIMHPTTATTLNVVSQCVIGSLTGGPNAIVSGAGLTCGGDNTSTIFAGNRSGSSGLTKAGSGTLTLTGTSATTGTLTVSAGTVQLGNAGTTGSIASTSISVTSGATLLLNRTDDYSLSNVLTGAGNITQIGSGKVTLTANTSSNTGVLTITSGTVEFTTTPAIVTFTSIVNNSALIYNRTTSGSYSNIISGSGTVQVSNSGLITLRGNNTYSGVTTIDSGSQLQIGTSNVGTLGTNSVVCNGTLSFVRSTAGNTSSVSNAISGTGTVTCTSSSTGYIALTGNNTHVDTQYGTGNTRIGNGGTSGTLGTGAFIPLSGQSATAIQFNRTDANTVSNAITLSASGIPAIALQIIGTGSFAFTGTITNGVTTNTIAVNGGGGFGGTSDFTLPSGIGTTTLSNSSYIFGGTGSGNSGTLTIKALTFSGAGNRLKVYSNGTGASKVDCGAATIIATSGITVDLLNTMAAGTYTLIASTGTVPVSLATIGTNSSGRTISSCAWVIGTGLRLILI